MNYKDIVRKVRSGVLSIEFYNGKSLVGGATGFMSNGYLVTNHHVAYGCDSERVVIASQPNKEYSSKIAVEFSLEEFRKGIVQSAELADGDIAIIDLPVLKDKRAGVYDFDIGETDRLEIGDDLILMGYPFNCQHLVVHFGRISSFLEMDGIETIQFDAMSNQSNSGGPLLCAETGKVLGVIAKKAFGTSDVMPRLKDSLEKLMTSASLKHDGYIVRSKDGSSEIDVGLEIVKLSSSIRQVCHELERSANVGIGYAFSLKPLVKVLGVKVS